MNQKTLDTFIAGYKRFRSTYMNEDYKEYRTKASKEQKPRIMMITCCDSRVEPAIVTDADLGDIFTVSNVANLVPPYKEGLDTHHSTSAALEFALHGLNIEHIIILGHSGCGGIRALMQGETGPDDGSYSFIQPWMSIAAKARDLVRSQYAGCSLEQQASACEKQALLISLENLKSFPWVSRAIAKGKLGIHAWHFSIQNGVIEFYCEQQKHFTPLVRS